MPRKSSFVERNQALGHEGIGNRKAQQVDETAQRLGCALPDDAVARQHDRKLRLADQLCSLLDLLVGRCRVVGRLHVDRLSLDFHLGDVLRKVDEAAAGLLGLRDLERLAHDLWNDVRRQHLSAVLGDRLEHADQIEDLVAFLVQSRGRSLAGDRHQRCAVHVGVGHTGDQVGRAGPQSGETDARLSGQPSIDVGHEGSALFVPGRDEFDLAVEQGVHHVDVLFTGNSEDVLDAFVFEAFDEELGCGHRKFLG